MFPLVFSVVFGSFLLSLSANCVLDPAPKDFTGINSIFTISDGLSVHVIPCSSVYTASPVLLWACPGCTPFRPRRTRSLLSSLVAFLLLTVESNPGPSVVRFGALNAGCAVHKGALIDDLIRDNRLDVLAVCESWIRDDDNCLLILLIRRMNTCTSDGD